VKIGLHIAMTSWEGGASRLVSTLAEVVETAEAELEPGTKPR
jgi:hypothetical protein